MLKRWQLPWIALTGILIYGVCYNAYVIVCVVSLRGYNNQGTDHSELLSMLNK